MKETLTLMDIYKAARSMFIQDYNFQQEQCEKMKKLMKTEPEYKEQYEKLLSVFEKSKKEASDRIFYMMELIGNEQEKTGLTDACPLLSGWKRNE